MSDTPALAIEGLQKTYGNGFEALKGIDLQVQQGDFFALLGPNGAGKSTTIGIIASLVNKSAGSVRVFGHDIDHDFPRAKKELGLVPQEFNFNPFEKPWDILINQAGYYGLSAAQVKDNAERYLKELGIWDKRNQPSRMLSGGMKRRLMIARALIHEPRLLILDEPTAGVDIELRRSMWQFLQKLNKAGTTIILTTHYLEEAEQLCRNIAIINHGSIVENTNMRSLLKQLQQEVLVLDLAEPLGQGVELAGFGSEVADSQTLEVTINKGQSLNDLFVELQRQNIQVASMRTKANRLEELFVSLLENARKG